MCGAPLNDGVCANCGWVQIIFPAEVPDSIQKFERERAAAARKLLDDKTTAKNRLDSVERTKGEVEKKLGEAKSECDALTNEVASKKREIANMQHEIAQLSARPKSAKPLAYLVIDNNGVLSAQGISAGCNRFVNRRGAPSRIIPDGMSLIPGMFAEAIDFEINATENGMFTIDSALTNVEIDGKLLRRGQSLLDGRQIKFERLPNLKITFSIPKK